ncbi:MAG TPA: HAD-IA family hydrolase [Blastocatellia bacterium]|nr:HAD-IA family hydrolase [Blastocatellia bacterium]
MNDTRAILFDLDGTLIDTTSLILACFEHSWKMVTGESRTREALVATFGMPLREAMKVLSSAPYHSDLARSGCGIETHLIDKLLSEYRSFNLANHDGMVRGFAGVEQVITELRTRGYLVGVVTSKGRELGQRGLALCSLDKHLDVAIFLEDTDRHKPGPEPLLKALERLRVQPCLAAYVGDSRHDVIAGRAAGVRTIAALWGPSPPESLEHERPDFMARSIADLLDIFPKMIQ